MLSFHLNAEIDVSSRKFSFINRSVDWIVAHFDIREGKSVADFGCGPGLYTERLAKTNAAITGIDFSKNSIEYARNRARNENLNINYVNQNYLEFTSDNKYDLIIMIMCDFCALSPEQRKTLYDKETVTKEFAYSLPLFFLAHETLNKPGCGYQKLDMQLCWRNCRMHS